MNEEEIKARAFAVKARYRAGELTYKEAKEQLGDYIDLYNKKAEEIGRKYGVKPKKFRPGEFLRS